MTSRSNQSESADPSGEPAPVVCFRLDASAQIGIGHLMRCLTLADALRIRGAEISFLLWNPDEAIRSRIADRGYALVVLGESGEPWTQQADSLGAIAACEKLQPDWLVVDHYQLDDSWDSSLRNHAAKIMVIDDFPRHAHDCDILLDTSPGRDDRYRELVPGSCLRLLGVDYALIHPAFQAVRRLREKDSLVTAVPRILISMGGSDPSDMTRQLVEALSATDLDVFADIIVGPLYANREHLDKLATGPELTVCSDMSPEEMALRISEADVAIAAGGVSSLERCCAGLPSILITIAENQEHQAEALQTAKAVIYAGTSENIDLTGLTETLKDLFQTPGELEAMSSCSMRLIDGQGADRIVDKMLT